MPEAPAVAAPTAVSPPVPSPSPQPAAPAVAAKPITPGSKAWAEMTQEQRFAQLRGPENPRARGHSPARDMHEAAAARAAGEPAPDAAAPAADPKQAPGATDGEKFKVGKFEVSEGELAAMMERQALDDLRKATAPPTPDAYKLEITPGAKLPGGLEFRFDGNDPGLVAAKSWAHSKGFDQGTFSEMLTMYASLVAQQETALSERSHAEIAKAGVNAPQRVDAVGKWITGMVGEADAKPIRATIVTDAHLRFYEGLITKLTNQGGASFSQSHRVSPDNDKIPGFEKMSFAQQRHAQEQLAARRNGR